MKNAMLIMISSLLFITVATESCKKDSGTTTPVTPAPTISSFTPLTARAGETVTITGTNFTGATAVSFGGTAAASFTVVNATTITAVLGTGANGDVSVTTPGGTKTLAGFIFNSSLPPVDGFNSSNDVEATSLIAYWPFDGNTTEKLHTAAPVLTGAGGTSTFVAGRIGQAISFTNGFLTYGPGATDASASNTPFNSNDTLQYGFTVSLWAQVPDTSLLTTLFALSVPGFPNWPILGLTYRRHANGASFDFDGGIGNVDGTGPHLTYDKAFVGNAFNDSLSWAFLTMTYAPGSMTTPAAYRYYANGTLRATVQLGVNLGGQNPFPDPAAALLMIAPNYVTIGAAGGVGSVPGATDAIPGYMSTGITGKIDDIRFFKKQLDDQKVNDLFILGGQGR